MDLTLYNKVYGDGVNKEIILGHTEYLEFCHLYCIIENHVWRVRSKVRS